ncbi:hypothetical protein ACHHV8_11160 [Paenibacillus sp. TAB 01]|uniref:hypothetical protein n=1 Tax=Paenibacillus sp. TAB 01 TaxID=3368988 RepID=UPI0037526BD1
MKLKELLEKALAAGLITQEQVNACQDDVNRIVSERVNDTANKYKPLTEENENLKKQVAELEPFKAENETLKQQVSELEPIKAERETLLSENNDLKTKVQTRVYEDTVNSVLKEVFKGKDFPDIYREKIVKSDDLEAVKQSVIDAVNLYKTNHPTEFGGGANPGQVKPDFSKESISSLLSEGIKETFMS